jgi:hypothetical protein
VHGERLMRALVIVAFEEAVELRLLLDEVRRRRPGGLQLQDEVHAFVAPVLLRMAWLDPLDLDGESQPPHRQAEIMMRFASEFGFGLRRQAVAGSPPPKKGSQAFSMGSRMLQMSGFIPAQNMGRVTEKMTRA